MYRRIHVPERPLIRRQLPVGMHVPFPQQQDQLRLRVIRIDNRQRYAVKRQAPCRVPRILPLVRHRNNVVDVQVLPLFVSPVPPIFRGLRPRRISLQPGAHVEVIKLLGPQHPRVRLPHHQPRVLRQPLREPRIVEFVCLFPPFRKHLVIARSKIVCPRHSRCAFPSSGRYARARPGLARIHPAQWIHIRQSHFQCRGFARLELQYVVRPQLRSSHPRIYRRFVCMNDVFVKRILHVRGAVAQIERFQRVRLVLREQKFRLPGAQQPSLSILPMLQLRAHRSGRVWRLSHRGTPQILAPTPRIPEPQRWQQVQSCRFRPAIACRDPHQNVVHIAFRVFDLHVKISVLDEISCIQ